MPRGSDKELRSISERLSALEAQVAAIAERLPEDRHALTHEIRHMDEYVHKDLDALREQTDRLRDILQVIYDEEPAQRRRLWALRESPEYLVPFEIENPLVSVLITTYSNAEALAGRSIPSILNQTYENFELIVVGDAASPEVEEAARSFDDPRVRFENLPLRGPYPEDRERMWFVAGCPPANEGIRLSRGHWLAPHSDDDAFTPDHIEILLNDARERRLELTYGLIRRRAPDGSEELLGAWPPEPYRFGIQSAIYHAGLKLFHYELADELFGQPGDWQFIRRLMRVGARIGRVEAPVLDYFPSKLWRDQEHPPLD